MTRSGDDVEDEKLRNAVGLTKKRKKKKKKKKRGMPLLVCGMGAIQR
jgi:hypothetical protein